MLHTTTLKCADKTLTNLCLADKKTQQSDVHFHVRSTTIKELVSQKEHASAKNIKHSKKNKSS